MVRGLVLLAAVVLFPGAIGGDLLQEDCTEQVTAGGTVQPTVLRTL